MPYTPRPSLWRQSALKSLPLLDFGGLNTSKHPEQIGDTESPDLLNVTIRDGTVRTRPGTSEVGSTSGTDITRGLFEYRKQSGSLFYLRVQGGKIDYATSLSGSWTNLKTGLNTSAKWCAAVANDFIYLMNGVDTPQRWNGSDASTTAVAAVKNGTACIYKFDRLIVAVGNVMWFSDPAAPETFGASSSFNVGVSDGGSVQQILSGPGNITLTKTNGRFEWYGGIGTGDAPKKISEFGAVGPRASVALPSGEVWMFTRNGIRRTYGTTDELVTDALTGTLKSLAWSQSADFAAGFFYQYVIFSIATAGSTYPNQWLIYDTIAQGWLLWSLQSSAFLTTADASGTPTLVFGNASGNSKIMQLADFEGAEATFNDLGSAYDAHYATKQFNCKVPDHLKKFKKLLYSFAQQNSQYYATVSYNPDDTGWTDFQVNLGAAGAPKYDSGIHYDTPGLKYRDATRVTGRVPNFSTSWMRTIQLKVGINVANEPFRLFQLVPHYRIKPSIS